MTLPHFVYPLADVLSRSKYILTGRGHRLHGSELYAPFFIVGSGRCGTTLLRRILQAGGQVHIPPEMHVLRTVISLFLRNRDRPWPDLVYLTLSRFEFHSQFDIFEVCLCPLARRLVGALPDRRNLASIPDGIYRYHGETSGQAFERWGDKTPMNVLCLDAILSVFPDAQFINLMRDGVDVVYSMLVKSGNRSGLADAASRWSRALHVAAQFRRRHAAQCCDARHEHLVTDPVPVVDRVCHFLESGFNPSMINSLEPVARMQHVSLYAHHEKVRAPVTADSIGRGWQNLSGEERAELQRLIGRDLARFDYEPAV